MAAGTTYGLNFPFRNSKRGDYLELTQFEAQEVKADLIHLLLTRKQRGYIWAHRSTPCYNQAQKFPT